MPRSRTLMLLVEVEMISSHWTSQAGVDQIAELVEAARRVRMMNSTVWIVKSIGAIHETIAKKTLSWQEPSIEHPNEGVAAEKAIAATEVHVRNDSPKRNFVNLTNLFESK